MSENFAVSSHPEICPANSLPPLRKSEVEPSMASRDLHALASRPIRGSQEEKEKSMRDASEEVRRLRRELGDLKGLLGKERAEIVRLRGVEEKLTARCRRRGERIMELQQNIEKTRGLHQGALEERAKQIQVVEERLKQTAELLVARTAELSETHTFLFTTDRLSEVEVLSIVRDLNENIFQVAVNLAEEWEKLESPQATSRMDIERASRPRASALVQLVRNRDLMGVTFLLQSILCSQAVRMTSGWGHYQESAILESVYKHLSASEGQAISAKWRSLAHSYLSQPPLHSGSLVEQLASALDETGSFSSSQHSIEFVRAVALEGTESMIQLAMRLESTFMVEVTSSDMSLLFEAPDIVFDDARMINEFGSDSASPPGKHDRIAGTTEVGVGKSISRGLGKARRAEILLKTKVVLEKDIVGDEEDAIGDEKGVIGNEKNVVRDEAQK